MLSKRQNRSVPTDFLGSRRTSRPVFVPHQLTLVLPFLVKSTLYQFMTFWEACTGDSTSHQMSANACFVQRIEALLWRHATRKRPVFEARIGTIISPRDLFKIIGESTATAYAFWMVPEAFEKSGSENGGLTWGACRLLPAIPTMMRMYIWASNWAWIEFTKCQENWRGRAAAMEEKPPWSKTGRPNFGRNQLQTRTQ